MRPFFTPYPIRYMPYSPASFMQQPPFPMPFNQMRQIPQMPIIPQMPNATQPLQLGQMMTQASKFMQSAQRYAPLFQEARPLLKNLPALWKLYKGFSSAPDTSAQRPATASPTGGDRPSARSQQPPSSRGNNSSQPIIRDTMRPSLPKIYQPNLDESEFY